MTNNQPTDPRYDKNTMDFLEKERYELLQQHGTDGIKDLEPLHSTSKEGQKEAHWKRVWRDFTNYILDRVGQDVQLYQKMGVICHEYKYPYMKDQPHPDERESGEVEEYPLRITDADRAQWHSEDAEFLRQTVTRLKDQIAAAEKKYWREVYRNEVLKKWHESRIRAAEKKVESLSLELEKLRHGNK